MLERGHGGKNSRDQGARNGRIAAAAVSRSWIRPLCVPCRVAGKTSSRVREEANVFGCRTHRGGGSEGESGRDPAGAPRRTQFELAACALIRSRPRTCQERGACHNGGKEFSPDLRRINSQIGPVSPRFGPKSSPTIKSSRGSPTQIAAADPRSLALSSTASVYIEPCRLPHALSHCSPSLVQAPPSRSKAHNEPEMSFAVDKASTSSDSDPKGPAPAYTLDEKRRAALAEIDNAKFSYVMIAS